MTGFQIRVRNVRLKSDPSGKVIISKATKKIPGRTTKSLFAEAERTEAQLRKQAAEHYTPIAKGDE